MADPLTAATIATLILTKIFEKQGEKVGEAIWKKGEQLLALIRHREPETAAAIEAVAQQPELAASQPANFGEATLIARVEQLAAAHPEVKAAVEEVAAAANAQPGLVQNFSKLAEQIGINIQGGYNPINIGKLF